MSKKRPWFNRIDFCEVCGEATTHKVTFVGETESQAAHPWCVPAIAAYREAQKQRRLRGLGRPTAIPLGR